MNIVCSIIVILYAIGSFLITRALCRDAEERGFYRGRVQQMEDESEMRAAFAFRYDIGTGTRIAIEELYNAKIKAGKAGSDHGV